MDFGFLALAACAAVSKNGAPRLLGPGCVVGELFVLVEARMNKIIGHEIYPQFRVHL